MKAENPLVVITRPAAQAEDLLQRLQQAGIEVLHQPVLEICPPEQPEALRRRLERARPRHQLALFTSLNAVQQAAALIHLRKWLAGKAVFAVGQATAGWLKQQGVQNVQVPAGRQTSEGLLALPALQAEHAPARAALFNAAGGRTLLQETLRQRGFEVEEFHVYRRRLNPQPTPAWRQVLEQRRPLLLTVTSTAMLEGLLQLAGERADWLKTQPLVVISERMYRHALGLGFEHLLQADHAGNTALEQTILHTLKTARPG